MKVLQINSVCGVGSTGRIATDIYHKLISEGNECVIAYGRGQAQRIPLEHTYRIGTDFDVYIHAGLSRITDRQGFYSSQATRNLIKFIEQYKPDKIYLHNIHGYYLNIEILFEFLSKSEIPIEWTLHDCWTFTGHCAHFTYNKCYKWKTGCENCPAKKDYPASYILSRAQKNFENKKRLFTSVRDIELICPSQWLANLVTESFLSKYPVKVVHNTIDLNIFKPTPSNIRQRYHLENKKIVLGVASIWGKRKGYDDMLALATMLPQEYQVVMIGLSKKQMRSLPKNLLGIMRTNNVEELVEWYSAADVFVNPTYEDNYPTVNLEAQACGTPVICYDTGGCRETLISMAERNIPKRGDINAIKNILLTN